MKKILLSIISIICFLILPTFTIAQVHYIRAGANGNNDGTNWINAWTSLPATLVRGHTYYIADGGYPCYAFNDTEFGDVYIYIKKATLSDHGTETGWDNSYGDGTAEFRGESLRQLNFTSDYWDLDGQIGSGKGGTYGFKVKLNAGGGRYQCLYFDHAHNINISHVEVEGAGMGVPEGKHDGLYFYGSSHINISYCYVHDFSRTLCCSITGEQYITFENNYFSRVRSDGIIHAGGLVFNGGGNKYHTIRHNIFEDLLATSCIEPKDSPDTGYIWVYGNVVFDVHNSNGFFGNTGGDSNNHMYAYNNTIVDCTGSVGVIFYNGTNNEAYNNLWYNCNSVSFEGVRHNYSAFDDSYERGELNAQINITSSIFKDYNNNNFSLRSATLNGKDDLGNPYNLDMNGIERGNGGIWDRGAYEFSSLSSPKNLKIVNISK